MGTMEAFNADIIDLVTKLEELKMVVRQADGEFESLEQQHLPEETSGTLENVATLENKIKQIQHENEQLSIKMSNMHIEVSTAKEEQENLKEMKNQLAIKVEESKKKAGFLAERKARKEEVTKAEAELKNLHQKAIDEEQGRSHEIAKIN